MGAGRVRRDCFLISVLSILLMGCDASSITQPKSKTKENTNKNICHEITDGSRGRCTSNLRPIFSNYVVKRGQVYWMTKQEYDRRPCLLGMGAYFHNMFSRECMTSENNQPYSIEERQLKKVAEFSSDFQPLSDTDSERAHWQKEQLTNYAKDKESVYFENFKIEGADPDNFSVIFPFGESEEWKRFSVSRSGKSYFLGWMAVEEIELDQFRAFTPVQCPENGLSCVKNYKDIRNGRQAPGMLGWIGEDIIYLGEYNIVRFRGMASPDMFMFKSRYKTYIHSRKKFYEMSSDYKTLIQMDIGYYERFNF